jgi:hypothetical protein
MTLYLLRQTRYTIDELNKLSDKKIEKWYNEERNIDKEA